ncbi:aldehyde dehydrogenase [Hysterangium stoloniferum]|nr:aldehyde dehydrogenase [Hysterangium stoloniferum]
MSSLEYTSLEEIPKIREHLRASFRAGKALDVVYRKEQLLQLAYLIQDNTERLQDALYQDLGRPKHESNLFDLGVLLGECLYAYKHIERWLKPQSVPFNINWSAFSPRVYKQAKGTVLIITPFNFPLYCLAPITGAIAAGCSVVVKLSELTPSTSSLLAELFPKYLDPDMYRVVNGGIDENMKLLELQWDHSGGKVGKIVATAAAKHLTPVTLELGGKCPAIVDENADFEVAAKRLLWGKMVNAGQTCAAPDYILVVKGAEAKLIEALKKQHSNFYGTNPHTSSSFSRIISHGHWDRLSDVLKKTKGKLPGQIITGGDRVREEKYIAPTIVQNVTAYDSLMQDEIFGPIFPIVSVPSIDTAVKYVNDHDHPLALYVFSKDAKVRGHVRKYTNSGAVVENDVMMHGSMPALPFGGVGPSGYGSHKGQHSFNTFVYQRPLLYSPNWLDLLLSIRFPPYTDATLKKINGVALPTIPYPRPGEKGGISWQWPLLVVSAALIIYKQDAIRRALNV